MKRPPRRTIIKVLLLLAAGATLNVAVAWGLVLAFDNFKEAGPARDEGQGWPAKSPRGWDETASVSTWSSWPLREVTAYGSDNSTADTAFAQMFVLESGFPYLSLHRAVCQSEGAGEELARASKQEPKHWREGVLLPESLSWMDRQERRTVPVVPLWPGFAINTLFYAGVLWVLFAGPFALRRMIRRRRGQCQYCAYPIGQSPVCTECGAEIGKKQ